MRHVRISTRKGIDSQQLLKAITRHLGEKTLIKDLEMQTEVLTKKVDELAATAKDAVARKNRVSALAVLRSKKLAETTLTKRHATLAQLEEVFSKIEQAADQVELVSIMEASTRVLTGLNEEVGGVERVDDDLVLIEAWLMGNRLAWVFGSSRELEGLRLVEGGRETDLADLVGVDLNRISALI